MAQKQLEEKIEPNEKEIVGLKEILFNLKKNIEKLTGKFVRVW